MASEDFFTTEFKDQITEILSKINDKTDQYTRIKAQKEACSFVDTTRVQVVL